MWRSTLLHRDCSGEDKDDPAWVVEAVRATLSSRGLTVDRTRAVTAFTRTYNDAPMAEQPRRRHVRRTRAPWKGGAFQWV
jgi:hypothetical protein